MRRRLVRPFRLAMVLAVGITVLATPAASADHSLVMPAGEGCSFDVLAQADHLPEPARDRNPVGFGNITFTNLDTGTTYLQRSRHIPTEIFDPETNTLWIAEKGRIFIQFLPGDQGPNGVVDEPGALLAFSGSIQLTWDLDTNFYTEFSYEGTFIDLCAKLAS
jgi:hypothetical protein